MLSTIVIVPPDLPGKAASYAPLVRTLASLVPATVAGTVRDVTVLRVGRSADAASIADEAGCRLVEAEEFGDALRSCVAAARASWMLVLRAGATPGRTFGQDVAEALDQSGDPPCALMLRQDAAGLRRLLPAFAPVAGVIAPRTRFEGRNVSDFAELLRRARPARTLRMRLAVMG